MTSQVPAIVKCTSASRPPPDAQTAPAPGDTKLRCRRLFCGWVLRQYFVRSFARVRVTASERSSQAEQAASHPDGNVGGGSFPATTLAVTPTPFGHSNWTSRATSSWK